MMKNKSNHRSNDIVYTINMYPNNVGKKIVPQWMDKLLIKRTPFLS